MSIPLSKAKDYAYDIVGRISLLTNRWLTVGEIRRGEDEVNQIDIVLIPSVRNIEKMKAVLGRAGRSVTDIPQGFEVRAWLDIKVIIHLANDNNFAFQTLFKTGPKPFLKALEDVAELRGYRLSEEGLLGRQGYKPAVDEGAIFNHLGIPYLNPLQRIQITKMGQLT